MNWNKPKTEQEWLEILSAYLDHELPEQDRVELEHVLKSDPVRRQQLIELRHTSRLLREYEIMAPSPDPVFIHRFVEEQDKRQSNTRWFSFRFPALHWSQFSIGFVTGILALILVQQSWMASPDRPLSGMPASGNESVPVVNIYMTPNQAEDLLQQVTAKGLINQMKTQIHNGKWEEAAASYNLLIRDYADSGVLSEIENDIRLQTFIKRYVEKRRLSL